MGARHVRRIFRDTDTCFYGDYDLDIYLGTFNDYPTLEEAVAAVLRRGTGWIRHCSLEGAAAGSRTYRTLGHVVDEFGRLSERNLRKMFPRRETGDLVRTLVLRYDGNFKMIVVESQRHLYYIFCFATS